MNRIRVLVIDDAVVVRKIVTDALSADPEIEVVGAAANGKIGLAKFEQLKPDLVTMDVEMPEMDGIETVRQLRKAGSTVPVVMFSTLTTRGATAALDALAAGASDYVTKPANVGSVTAAQARIREELIPRIKALCARHRAPAAGLLQPPPTRTLTAADAPVFLRPARISREPIQAVLIGVSTGGPNALAEVFPHLSGELPVPILVVQHMPPVFTRLLADRLSAMSRLPVREATAGEPILPGTAYIAPGDYHLEIAPPALNGPPTASLTRGEPEHSCRPAVDVLFRSAVRVFGGATLGVILTGMGNDGVEGCRQIVAAGGSVIAQDQASSVVWGMPGAAARAGLAEQLLPLKEIAAAINRRVIESRSPRRLSA